MLNEEFIDLLKGLIRAPSVVGAEHSFFRVLQRELEERGAKVTWYEGVLVAQGSDPFSTMFSAHIDRHGLVCTGPNEFQYAAFVSANRTDLLNNSVSEQLMTKVTERFNQERVYAYETWSGGYRGKGVIRNGYICEFRNNLIFEVDGLEGVVAGTPVAFEDTLSKNGDRLEGQLDNVLCAAALVHMFSLGFKGTAFFTAQEEAGKSWRYLLEWFRRFGGTTNRLFVVDTSPFPDIESANEQLLVLREKDANASFNPESTALLEKLCQDIGFSYLFKNRYVEAENEKLVASGQSPNSLGSTELGRIIAASNGLVDGTTLQIPTTGYHTMHESASIASINAFLTMLTAIANL
ncbi:peptidase M42 [Marinomonas communis]|uniref:Putative aminopeptidase FrvX n=1 Tax=Marinomonas communis TaxID=28254 RepID=A0A4R6X7B4_9GAMM|nr:peptidase M42 [Marinomonas communis]MCC4273471.1 peptidase M42 [Marinomonas communis]MEC8080015.1 peptidase M42 [Pseudomonadota bacterium]MEC8485402.1 peptidase M42 [Pseudomonadota bacterium]TDR13819.1 putative aminopeptidase FrvX [Marinomonas communis]